MISAVSASEVEEAVDINSNAEAKIHEFVEVNQPDLGEIETDDIVVNDVITEEAPTTKYNQEYNDSNIINNEPQNYNEIENYQYNGTYIESVINETLNYDTDLDLNKSIVSFYIFNNLFNDNDVNIMKMDFNFKVLNFTSTLSKFKEINKFKVLTHEDLIFYNNYYHILTHGVEKNMILSDKLHTKFAFSIDNSIVGSANDVMYHILNSYFSNFNLFSLSCFQTFSNFVQIFIKINSNEYSFFLLKQSNDKYNIREVNYEN